MIVAAETVNFPGSSSIDSATYDPDQQKLSVTFRGGRTYAAEGVPAQEWGRFQSAGSAGSYYARTLAQWYDFQEE